MKIFVLSLRRVLHRERAEVSVLNGIEYLKSLEAVGFTREQAEAQVEVMSSFNSQLVTRADAAESQFTIRTDFARLRAEFAELKNDFAELKEDFAGLRDEFAELKGEFAELRAEFAELKSQFAKLEEKLDSLETRLVFKLGGLMVTLFTIGMTVIGFLVSRH